MNINIQGDGNTIGNGNKTIINKNTTINNNNGGDGNGSGNKEDEFPVILIVAGAAAIALAIAAWKFAQYAPQIYLILKIWGFTLVSIKLVTTFAMYRHQPTSWVTDQITGLAATCFILAGVFMSSESYRHELTNIALNANGWKGFICGISNYGIQLSTFHMLTMSFLATIPLMFITINATGSLSRWAAFSFDSHFFGRLAALQKRSIAIVALVFAILCLTSQFDFVVTAWEGWFDPKMIKDYVCK